MTRLRFAVSGRRLALTVIGAACVMPAVAQEPTIKLSGRVQLDYNVVDADNADFDLSASEARNVRLAVAGDLSDRITYKAELHTDSSGDVVLTDAFLNFRVGDSPWSIQAGQMKTPNSLDEQTSARFTSTYERAAFTDAFEFDRRVGVMAQASGDHFTFAGGVFGENIESDSTEQGYALAARGTYAIEAFGDGLAHVGGSVRYREQGDGSGLIRYRQRPFAHMAGRVISTGSIAESDLFVGIEAAALASRYWAAGEYGVTKTDCTVCAQGDPDVSGYYLEAGAFIGGRKVYKGGKFDRPAVDHPFTTGGGGAWSFVARVDSVDLADGSVDGGDLQTYVLGADWWPTRYSRIGINVFRGDVDYGLSTSGLDPAFAAEVISGTSGDTVDGAVVRLQFDF